MEKMENGNPTLVTVPVLEHNDTEIQNVAQAIKQQFGSFVIANTSTFEAPVGGQAVIISCMTYSASTGGLRWLLCQATHRSVFMADIDRALSRSHEVALQTEVQSNTLISNAVSDGQRKTAAIAAKVSESAKETVQLSRASAGKAVASAQRELQETVQRNRRESQQASDNARSQASDSVVRSVVISVVILVLALALSLYVLWKVLHAMGVLSADMNAVAHMKVEQPSTPET
eukprot:NODE_306_length_1939_cov_108.844974_g256_i0.p2 GENE.NODE_306_length_1939_cov_108.844974_g256_i0~~NODE_306_length_1939_cov_108.844974_g256_i0.p2  ORF type:complete len:231 (+),score=54.13 NODE_306_length_1939_cov_108.844974_g256_i0:204-896(+)